MPIFVDNKEKRPCFKCGKYMERLYGVLTCKECGISCSVHVYETSGKKFIEIRKKVKFILNLSKNAVERDSKEKTEQIRALFQKVIDDNSKKYNELCVSVEMNNLKDITKQMEELNKNIDTSYRLAEHDMKKILRGN